MPASPRPAKAPKSQATLERKAVRRLKREAGARELGTMSLWEQALIRQSREARKWARVRGEKIELELRVIQL